VNLILAGFGGKIDILLGMDHSHQVVPLEIRSGSIKEPYAFKSKFGLVVTEVLGGIVS
jgi:hypothetical protein